MIEKDHAVLPQGWDSAWEQVFSNQEWGQYPPEHVIRFVARRWYREQERSAVRLLDLGCGPGASVWYMAREGFTVAGIDGSATAVGKIKNRLAREHLTADLRVGDFLQLPWADAYFDGVIDNVALCHNTFRNCKRAAAEVLRVLKPGGHFLSCSFTDRTWGYGEGIETEAGGFSQISVGPLANKGFCLLLSRSQLGELFQSFVGQVIERQSWTIDQMQHRIEQWVVEAQRPTV
jgi:SAM-dependent methyltransferase